MRKRFTIMQELELVDEFCRRIPGRYGKRTRRGIKLFGKVFHALFNDSFLNHVHSTEWVVPWLNSHKRHPKTQESLLGMSGRFCNWLFERKVISDNAMLLICRRKMAAGKERVLILPEGVHRLYREYQPPYVFSEYMVVNYRRGIGRYIRFMAEQPGAGNYSLDEAFGKKLVFRWIRHISHGNSFHTVYSLSSYINHFMDHLVSINKIHANPIRDMMRKYGCNRNCLIKAAISADPEVELAKFKKKPLFQSEISGELYRYIEWKEQAGRKVSAFLPSLRNFDAFLLGRHDIVPITGSLMGEYAESIKHLSPVTRINILTIVRGFCSFMKRTEPKTFVIYTTGRRAAQMTARVPYIVMPELFLKIITEIKSECKKARYPHIEKGLVVALELLYATGLRIGEAFRLTRKNVDLEKGTLCVQKTKFNKTRIIPISDSLRKMLANFARFRDSSPEMGDSGILFFPTSKRVPIKEASLRRRFHNAARKVVRTELKKEYCPRIHDLRHSFAVRNLLRWYNQGYDVQNKLPVLATYLGHVSIASTQTYITATGQLLDAASFRFQNYAGSLIEQNIKDIEI